MRTLSAFVVIALVVTLATACGENYQIYKGRSEVSVVMDDKMVSWAKLGVMEYDAMNRHMPANLAELEEGIGRALPEPGPGSSIAGLRIDNGTIILTLSGHNVSVLDGKVIALALCMDQSGAHHWACGSGTCRAGLSLAGPDPRGLTTVSPELLPATCR